MFWKFVVGTLVLALSVGLEIATASVPAFGKNEVRSSQPSSKIEALVFNKLDSGQLTPEDNTHHISQYYRHYHRPRHYRRYYHYRPYYYRRHYYRPYYRGIYYVPSGTLRERHCPNNYYWRYRRVYRHGVDYPYYYYRYYR